MADLGLESPAPKVERKQTAPAFGTKGYLRWRTHQAVAGDRPEDRRMRKRAAGVSALGLALYVASELWGVTKPIITEWPKQQAARDERLAAALEELARGLDRQATSIEALAQGNERVINLALDRVQGPIEPAKPAARPRRYQEGERR